MNKKNIGLISILIGFVLNGFSWSTLIGHPINTIFLLTGLGLIIIGIILISLKQNK
jgi:hypothetical protein